MNKDMIRCQSESERKMAKIINEQRESLDNFLFNKAGEHDIRVAQTYIAFALAAHFAIKCQIEESK